MKRKGLPIINKFSPVVTGISKLVKHATNSKIKGKPNPASIYVGTWSFTDELSQKVHQLEISPELTISLDGRQLQGNVQHIDINELIFLDNYGYLLRIDAVDHHPISVFDEADERVYTLYVPKLNEADESHQ